MFMLNVFAYRSTQPQALYRIADPIGLENDDMIARLVNASECAVGCWGNHGILRDRGEHIRREPRHPLYLASDTRRRPWRLS